VEQIQTHKGPSDESLFHHKAPSVKSIPPSPLFFHQEDATENYPFIIYSGNIYLQMCVWLFHFSVTWFSEMQFVVMYFETWGNTQPYAAFSALVFCSCFIVFGVTRTALNSLKPHEPVSVVS
jgi:hypothetical protein